MTNELDARAQRLPLLPSARTDHSTGSERSPDATARGGATPPARGKQRDPFFDNAKYLAILFVAIGHSWEPLRDESRTAAALYIFVYTFHMPAFMMISGYFSRGFEGKPHQLKRLVTGVLVPYVVFELAYTFFKRWADDDPTYAITVLDPWYLT